MELAKIAGGKKKTRKRLNDKYACANKREEARNYLTDVNLG